MPIPTDTVVAKQLPIIQEVIRNETWLEGERRGRPVSPTDPVVRARVCEIVLREGATWRAQFSQSGVTA